MEKSDSDINQLRKTLELQIDEKINAEIALYDDLSKEYLSQVFNELLALSKSESSLLTAGQELLNSSTLDKKEKQDQAKLFSQRISRITTLHSNLSKFVNKKYLSYDLQTLLATKNSGTENENNVDYLYENQLSIALESKQEFHKFRSILNFEICNAVDQVNDCCKLCKGELKWHKSIYNSNKFKKCKFSDTCNKKNHYACESCEQLYCTSCICITKPDECGCGVKMVWTRVYGNNCDVCTKSITSMNSYCFRCSNCDNDCCYICYNNKVEVETKKNPKSKYRVVNLDKINDEDPFK